MQLLEILKAFEILSPLIEELIDALRNEKKIPDFVSKLPEPSRARVALRARQAGLK
jgi:hypothetical protein